MNDEERIPPAPQDPRRDGGSSSSTREELASLQRKLAEAEAHAAELGAQLAEAQRSTHALQAELLSSRRETEAARSDTEARCAELDALETRLQREQDERQALSLRAMNVAQVPDESDPALLRDTLLETDLNATRGAHSGRLRAGQTAELLAALAREEDAARQAGHARELEAAHAERDALASEVRRLRVALGRVRRALSDLDASRGADEPDPRLDGDTLAD